MVTTSLSSSLLLVMMACAFETRAKRRTNNPNVSGIVLPRAACLFRVCRRRRGAYLLVGLGQVPGVPEELFFPIRLARWRTGPCSRFSSSGPGKKPTSVRSPCRRPRGAGARDLARWPRAKEAAAGAAANLPGWIRCASRNPALPDTVRVDAASTLAASKALSTRAAGAAPCQEPVRRW